MACRFFSLNPGLLQSGSQDAVFQGQFGHQLLELLHLSLQTPDVLQVLRSLDEHGFGTVGLSSELLYPTLDGSGAPNAVFPLQRGHTSPLLILLDHPALEGLAVYASLVLLHRFASYVLGQ